MKGQDIIKENRVADFRSALASGRTLLLDGGMGTMLQARGLPAGEHPEQFCLDRPDVLRGIHADYLAAGADIILTCTFGGSRLKLPAGIDVTPFNRTMARIARAAVDAAGREAFVAGDMGPCGQFVRPLGDLHPLELYEALREQARGLVEGGVDLFLIETQFDLAEVRIAVAAIRAESDLPIMVSMTFEQGTSLTGTTPEIFAETMQNLGVDALGLNCGLGPEQMAPLMERFLACSSVPVLAEPNAGLPELVDGKTVFRLPPEPFAEKTAAFVGMGARLVGGCCGTTPDHIAALRRAVDAVGPCPAPAVTPSGIVLTTRTRLVRVSPAEPFKIIGERINPTGKKDLQAELQAGEYGLAMRFASEQVALGAPILDVNVGAPMVDEALLLPELVQRLTGKYAEPLSLDSSHAEAIAAALPFCPGSPLVNSISGEADRMEHLGPLCRQWGAPFILLPIQGRKLPVKAADRIAIIENMLDKAAMLGIPRRLVLVDVLALAVVIALRVLPPMNAPAQSAAATPTPAATIAPTPTPEPDNGLPKVNTGSWELTLVNAHNSIGEAVPEDLAELEGGRYFDARAVDALKEFIAAARAEGLSVCLSSAYRSYNEQTYLFNRKVSQCGGDEAAAARIVNRPGTSEHQLGLCADITDKFYEVKTQALEKTALYQWMYAHCQDYGFILRYPADKQDITGVMYEPWHFRYVGKEAAAYIMGNGLCLEEFLDLYK